ncbi:MAG: hypothetical protein ACI4EU_05140 [Butyrivibrio sp.]
MPSFSVYLDGDETFYLLDGTPLKYVKEFSVERETGKSPKIRIELEFETEDVIIAKKISKNEN